MQKLLSLWMSGLSSVMMWSVLFTPFILIGQEHSTCGTVWDEIATSRFDSVLAKIETDPINRDKQTFFLNLKFHSVGDSQGKGHLPVGEYLDAFATINRHFKQYDIRFVLDPEINYIDNSSYYDHTSTSTGSAMMIKNKKRNYINVFVVKNAANNAGYYLPSSDAVAIRRSEFMNVESSTLTHELGHFFTLPHTFLGWEGYDYADYKGDTPQFLKVSGSDTTFVEYYDGSNCKVAGDRICDTKADYLSDRWYCSGGFSSQVIDPTGRTFKIDGSNFMSYSDDNCHAIFSDDQTDIMVNSIRLSRSRYINNSSENGAIDFTDARIRFPQEGQDVRFDDVYIEWKPVDNANYYLVELYSYDILIDSYRIGEYITATHSVKLDDVDLESGRKYYYRIRPFNRYHVAPFFSKLHSFTAAVATDVNFVDGDQSISIAPSIVTSGELNIDIDLQNAQYLGLTITDMTGKRKWQDQIKTKSQRITVDVANFASGVYIFTLQTDRSTINKRFIIQ